MRDIVPASHRATSSHARGLSPWLHKLLGGQLTEIHKILKRIFPIQKEGIQPPGNRNFLEISHMYSV
jgi:hypothetical protein